MPTISRFYGIVIAMYFGDHPPPHFHAWYSGQKGRTRRSELKANWRLAEAEMPLQPIEPLP